MPARYGLSKAAALGYVEWFARHCGLPATSLILGNVYGPDRPARRGDVITRFLADATAGRASVLHGDGCATRDFVHVDDVTDAMLRACTAPAAGRVNIGSGIETSISDVRADQRRDWSGSRWSPTTTAWSGYLRDFYPLDGHTDYDGGVGWTIEARLAEPEIGMALTPWRVGYRADRDARRAGDLLEEPAQPRDHGPESSVHVTIDATFVASSPNGHVILVLEQLAPRAGELLRRHLAEVTGQITDLTQLGVQRSRHRRQHLNTQPKRLLAVRQPHFPPQHDTNPRPPPRTSDVAEAVWLLARRTIGLSGWRAFTGHGYIRPIFGEYYGDPKAPSRCRRRSGNRRPRP